MSIITDYDLKTGVCELIDNALDHWTINGRPSGLEIDIDLDVDRQVIKISDNAGGVHQDDVTLLIAPGASRMDVSDELIGTFGVGGKRAGVALGEHVEIRTRHLENRTIQLEITKDWLDTESWDMDIYEVPPIEPSTTIVEISRVRQGFDREDVSAFFAHLGETYGKFIDAGCIIRLGGNEIGSVSFENFAFPPDFLPTKTSYSIRPSHDGALQVEMCAGLIRERDPENLNYGVYFFCNERLVVKELRVREVGYYVTPEAGTPHYDASLCRVVVKLNGPPELMPWNSSKSGLNFSHTAFKALRPRIIDLTSHYSKLSRRFKSEDQREAEVYRFEEGDFLELEPHIAASTRKSVMPKLPRTRRKTPYARLFEANLQKTNDMPWTLGLIEAFCAIDVLVKQKLETKNRFALILLDSNLEIGLKEFIVNRRDLFCRPDYTPGDIKQIISQRTSVMKEAEKHLEIDATDLGKIKHYYAIRNKVIHEAATVEISDNDISNYRGVVERVLNKAFALEFPK